MACLVLPFTVFGQTKIKQENYYNVPVPEDLKASSKDVKPESKTGEYKVSQGKVTYMVRIKYNPTTKKESVYSIEILSDNEAVNKKLAKMSSLTGKPGNISACYSGEKQKTADWHALADCVVNYVQALL